MDGVYLATATHPSSLVSFATHPSWTLNYLLREPFELSNLKDHIPEGSNVSISVSDYFSTMLDQTMDWDAAAEVRERWGKAFCLKGIMSVRTPERRSRLAQMPLWYLITEVVSSMAAVLSLISWRRLSMQSAIRSDVICDAAYSVAPMSSKRSLLARRLALAVGGTSTRWLALVRRGGASATNMQSELVRDMKLMGAKTIAT